MSRVTVLVPTAARPETLEVTLRGVAKQTAIDQIAEVIVSENLGDARSGEVCERFPELPISYRLRQPSLGTMMQHAAHLFAESTSELTAFVCDDDVWSPGHLESAIASLDRRPDAAAHFSGFIATESDLALDCTTWAAPLLWLAAGSPARMTEYVYDRPEVLALAWIITPFQWSTLVGRTSALVSAAPALTEAPHFFYADRMLITALASHGKLILDPAVDTLYRVYEGNWSRGQSPEALAALLAECEGLVWDEAGRIGVDLPAMWRAFLTDAPADVADLAKPWLSSRFSRDELARWGLADLLPPDPSIPSVSRRIAGRLLRTYNVLRGKSL